MRGFLTALAMISMAAAPAFAQSASGAGDSTSTGTASNTVNVVAVTGPQVQATDHIKYSGHTYTTPGVGGSYFAGANPCLIGIGAGAAGGPAGININVGKNDKGCTRRSDAAAWHALGMDGVAITRMCQDEVGSYENADAFYAATGFACPGSNAKGRYKLADGSLAPYAILGNATRIASSVPTQHP